MILLGSERPNINVRQYSRLKDRSQGTREGGTNECFGAHSQ